MLSLEMELYSEVLHGDGEVRIYLPDRSEPPYDVLWLFHGAFGEGAESVLLSSVVRYAENRGMAVIAPTCYLGVYTDMVYGENGYSFVRDLTEKLPRLLSCLSTQREHNYLMGISMGGHGTFKLGLEFPDRFAGLCGFSSPVDMVYTMQLLESGNHPGGHELFDAFGSSEAYRYTSGDVLYQAQQLQHRGVSLPKMALCWGDDEFAGPECARHKKEFEKIGIRLFTLIGHGGHNFDTWDPMMERVLDYLREEESPCR